MGIDVEPFVADGYVRIPGAVQRRLALKIGKQAALLVGASSGTPWRLGAASVGQPSDLRSNALTGAGRWHLAANWGPLVGIASHSLGLIQSPFATALG